MRDGGMKVKKYTTQPGLLGSTIFFDVQGNKVGVSRPGGLMDRIDYYDVHGNKKGHSEVAPLGQRIYYDAQGNRIGTSGSGILDSTIYYDNSGRNIGVSEISTLGGRIYYEIGKQRRKIVSVFAVARLFVCTVPCWINFSGSYGGFWHDSMRNILIMAEKHFWRLKPRRF